MKIKGLDNWLTSEPDNGFMVWCEKVWEKIPVSEISEDEHEQYEDLFNAMENSLSVAGTTPNGFLSVEFAAHSIQFTFRHFKNGKMTTNLAALFRDDLDLKERYGQGLTPL